MRTQKKRLPSWLKSLALQRSITPLSSFGFSWLSRSLSKGVFGFAKKITSQLPFYKCLNLRQKLFPEDFLWHYFSFSFVKSITWFAEGILKVKQDSFSFELNAKSPFESISIPIITSKNLLPETSTTGSFYWYYLFFIICNDRDKKLHINYNCRCV